MPLTSQALGGLISRGRAIARRPGPRRRRPVRSSLDDGVCMEIGYAAALGVPIVMLTTDFQIYGTAEHGAHCTFLMPSSRPW